MRLALAAAINHAGPSHHVPEHDPDGRKRVGKIEELERRKFSRKCMRPMDKERFRKILGSRVDGGTTLPDPV